MECPGLYSIYSEIDCSFAGGNQITYEVERIDRRFSRATIALSGALSGRIQAFVRPAPIAQSSYADVSAKYACRDLVGRRALVIGGSRGIGEALVKALCARGAETRFTYNRGVNDAQKLVDEIAVTRQAVSAWHLDVHRDVARSIAAICADGWAPTHCYYMASPPIFVSRSHIFSPELFAAFCQSYVADFAAVLGCLTARPLSVFYPSSVAVDAPIPGLLEYAAAKAAGECLCHALSTGGVSIVIDRLPRTLTDQTATLFPVPSEPAEAVAERILKEA